MLAKELKTKVIQLEFEKKILLYVTGLEISKYSCSKYLYHPNDENRCRAS